MFDWFHGEVVIEDLQDRILARDRFRLAGADIAARCPGLTGGFATQGSLFVIHRQGRAAELVEALRSATAEIAQVYSGASELPSGCGAWLRILAADAVGLRTAMTAAWRSERSNDSLILAPIWSVDSSASAVRSMRCCL